MISHNQLLRINLLMNASILKFLFDCDCLLGEWLYFHQLNKVSESQRHVFSIIPGLLSQLYDRKVTSSVVRSRKLSVRTGES